LEFLFLGCILGDKKFTYKSLKSIHGGLCVLEKNCQNYKEGTYGWEWKAAIKPDRPKERSRWGKEDYTLHIPGKFT
jgi:hypothetical protein